MPRPPSSGFSPSLALVKFISGVGVWASFLFVAELLCPARGPADASMGLSVDGYGVLFLSSGSCEQSHWEHLCRIAHFVKHPRVPCVPIVGSDVTRDPPLPLSPGQ